MIAQTIVLNCISFVFELGHFFMFISHLYILIFSLRLILGRGEVVVSYFKELISYWENKLWIVKHHRYFLRTFKLHFCYQNVYDCHVSKYIHVHFTASAFHVVWERYLHWVHKTLHPCRLLIILCFLNSHSWVMRTCSEWNLEVARSLPFLAIPRSPVTARLCVTPSCPPLRSRPWRAPFLPCASACHFFCLLSLCLLSEGVTVQAAISSALIN